MTHSCHKCGGAWRRPLRRWTQCATGKVFLEFVCTKCGLHVNQGVRQANKKAKGTKGSPS